jgi:hypothetical protein
MGWQPVNMGSSELVLFLRKNHIFHHPASGSVIGKQKYGSTPDPDWTKISTLPHTATHTSEPGRSRVQRSNSTNRSGAQSPCWPLIGSRRSLHAGSPKESSDAAPSHRTVAASREIDVKAPQILAHRTLHMPRCIPPTGAGDAGSTST